MVSNETVETRYQCKRCETVERKNVRRLFITDPRDEITGLCGECAMETVWRRIT